MLTVKNLNKSFGDKVIFKNFSFTIKTGEFVVISGKSGSGKSTLLNILGLLDTDYSGEVIYDGVMLKKLNSGQSRKFVRDNVNYLFQNYALIDDKTVEENLLLALYYTKKSKAEKNREIKNCLSKVGLEGYEKKKIYTLSGGEQQRIALARTLIKPGNLILADEPTGNLDEENRNQVIEFLREQNNMGKTVVIVTHDSSVAKDGDRVINL